MISYIATKAEFIRTVKEGKIADAIENSLKHLRSTTPDREKKSWVNSMQAMSDVLEKTGIPDDAGIHYAERTKARL